MYRLLARGRSFWEKKRGAKEFVFSKQIVPVAQYDESLENWASSVLLESDSEGCEQILDGTLSFLNYSLNVGCPIDWHLPSQKELPRLWVFHLHYHEFVKKVLAGWKFGNSNPKSIDWIWDVVCHWIDNNNPSDPRNLENAWHPYCISRRLPVWILAWLTSPPPELVRQEILINVYAQTNYLASHLEKDLGGNHLLDNLRALILASCFLGGDEAKGWLSKAVANFSNQLSSQVLEHGEHFERSPMYHVEMLELVLDVRDSVAFLYPDESAKYNKTAHSMAKFLLHLLHPDGDIPLLSDSVLVGKRRVEHVLVRAFGMTTNYNFNEPEDSKGHRLGEYWKFRDKNRNFVLFDAAPTAVDYLPAHAHADVLGFEVSLSGKRVFVDSGVYGYEDDSLRAYCRSSYAHNVLVVNGLNQCDVWSRFRMSYRGHPEGLEHGESSGFSWARATHNCYRRSGVPVVGRWFAARQGGTMLCLDWAKGNRSQDLSIVLNLHPDIEVQQVDDRSLGFAVSGSVWKLTFFNSGKLELFPGWYCSGFGDKSESTVICYSWKSELPSIGGWYLSPTSDLIHASLVGGGPLEESRVIVSDGEGELTLFPFGG